MSVRRVITFRASSLGDALMAKYQLENVRAAYPDARCGLLVAGRGGMIRDLLAAYPWIEVIEANRTNLKGLWTLWSRFRRSDLVTTSYVKPGGRFSFPSKLVARMLARRGGMFGFVDASTLNGLLYDRIVPSDYSRAPRLLEQDILNAAGIPIAIPHMSLKHLPQPELSTRLGLEGKKYLVVHMFAGSDGRAMSQEKRQALIDALAREVPGTPLLLTGTKAERPMIEALSLPLSAHVVAGDLSVQELAALIHESACMVSIGTGPSHMASHLGTPLLVLVVCVGIPWCGRDQFGENAAVRIFSDVDACRDRHRMAARSPACIEGIDVEDVARSAAAYVGACPR